MERIAIFIKYDPNLIFVCCLELFCFSDKFSRRILLGIDNLYLQPMIRIATIIDQGLEIRAFRFVFCSLAKNKKALLD
jgi:hypothetical protein